jgi:drug/metabolite transporter (DMT)-like permease
VTINGIPLHPLVVHAAVVLVPLAALFATAYAVLPRRRWQTRTPAIVLALVGAVSVWLASMTGDNLKSRLHENTAIIHTHEMWAGRLQASMWVLAALTAVAWWSLPHHSPLPDKDHREGVTTLAKPLVILLPVAAFAVLVLVVLTGDAGARAVWGGQ